MNKIKIDPQYLIEQATQAREKAYAPYSSYQVGAAVLCDDGRVFSGGNVENAVYPLTICAERVTITQAISAGAKKILAVAVVTSNGGTPCGSCRQVIREFGAPDLKIFVAKTDQSYTTYTLEQLLPHSFSEADLAHSRASDT